MNRTAILSKCTTWFIGSMILIAAGCATHSTETTVMESSPTVCQNGNCGSRCSRCRKPCRQNRRCPKCETDACYLCAECVCEESECFEVEQKVICIPPVSLPRLRNRGCNDDCGSRCSRKCAKTKVVKVLKTRTCSCPTCKYTWKLCETPLPERSPFSQVGPTGSEDTQGDEDSQLPAIRQPGFEENELYDPSGGDVPAAPGTVQPTPNQTTSRWSNLGG